MTPARPATGLGLDVVHVPDFERQLADRASGFVAATFTPGELAGAPGDSGRRARYLAGRFAAKEAFVKAWSSTRRGQPPSLASVDLREIDVARDGWDRPYICLRGEVARHVPGADISVSISHDGPTAAAVVVLVVVSAAVIPAR